MDDGKWKIEVKRWRMEGGNFTITSFLQYNPILIYELQSLVWKCTHTDVKMNTFDNIEKINQMKTAL